MSDSEETSELVRASAVGFMAGRVNRSRLRGWIGRSRPVDRALWKECADLGWTGMLLPESLGGMGSSLRDALTICEESGRHLFGEPLVASALMPAVLLAAGAAGPASASASELAGSLARALIDGVRTLCVAWQEGPGRLSEEAPACEVRHGRTSGVKQFVVGCEPDSVALVWAMRDGEAALFAVDVREDGVVRDSQPAGLGAHCELKFNNTPVLWGTPLLVGPDAARALNGALAVGRLGMAAELCGLAAGCLELTLAHLRTRRQFDRPLGSFQALQHRCVDLHLEVELARASWLDALGRLEAETASGSLASVEAGAGARAGAGAVASGILPGESDAAICAAKARAGEAAVRVGRESVQFHGAIGFCDDVDVGLYLRAALHGNSFLGGPTVLRRRFAAWHTAQSESLQRAANV